MNDWKGKVAVVTGATKGIGRGIADALAAAGMHVAVAARHENQVTKTAQELIGKYKIRSIGVPCDVRVYDDCRTLIQRAASELGSIDVLVNNAGVGVFAPVADMSVEDWHRVIETNVNSLFYCSHEALPHLRRAGGGWIINIGSLAGKNAFPNGAAYNASKFAVIGFSEAMMQEVRYDGIRVSYIMPGSVATEFGASDKRGTEWMVQPEDIAQLVTDLLSMPARTLPSRIEVRPSQPPRK